MDDTEFSSSTFQRVYKYLKKHSINPDLDHFTFHGSTEDTTTDYLDLFIRCRKFNLESLKNTIYCVILIKYRNCGVEDPSWSEIHHFVKFLDMQLEPCENTVFFNESIIHDIMPGIKEFVVKFMITMSRVSPSHLQLIYD